jgi:hypothetical protein
VAFLGAKHREEARGGHWNRHRRAAGADEIQQLFREINDRVSQARNGLSAVRMQFLCECASLDCFELIELTAEEYRRLRVNRLTFAVRPDAAHLHTEIERVLSKEGGYWIVQRLPERAERFRADSRWEASSDAHGTGVLTP